MLPLVELGETARSQDAFDLLRYSFAIFVFSSLARARSDLSRYKLDWEYKLWQLRACQPPLNFASPSEGGKPVNESRIGTRQFVIQPMRASMHSTFLYLIIFYVSLFPTAKDVNPLFSNSFSSRLC